MNTPALTRGYEVVIGIETHAQLSTRSKIFSGSSTAFGAAPNTQASAVDLALPGTLPVLNRGAVERAIRFGLAVEGSVAPHSIFARKNYFYPDLPKGYQISQYETPVVQGGRVSFLVAGVPHTVNLTRAHLEEDAGKSLHEDYQGQSGIDLNRAGTPLLEIVTEPDMRSSEEAVAYAKQLHAIVTWNDLCDGNMQEGSFRCDANVSVRKPGAPYGTRREIKNLNSFKFMQQAIDYEIEWQIDLLEDGGSVHQATVLFDPDSGSTRAMRSKEDAADYRYFPDPDLPPLVIAKEWIDRVRNAMPEQPDVKMQRYQDKFGLSAYDAALMTQSRAMSSFFEATESACRRPKLAANWLTGEVSRRLNAEGRSIEDCPVRPETLGALITRIVDQIISNSAAKQVLDALWNDPGKRLDDVIIEQGHEQMSATELGRIVDEVLAANPKSVEEYRAGKEKAFNALVGQAMKATRGKANPEQVNALLKNKLG
ncbi:MAG TPA: Asp-tRNA(Asn)/Glu-tRNA(Gln) amidotransferase subunit GatB [Caldimonas sp.]